MIDIKRIPNSDMNKALELVWSVFLEYEAPDYTEEGINEFKKTIDNMNWINDREFYGAYIDNTLTGVIATKDNIDTVVESINSEMASRVKSAEFDIVKVEGKTITTESVFDPKVMISNQLNTPKETINFYRDKISDFEPFFVSLQDKNYTYVLEKKNNE